MKSFFCGLSLMVLLAGCSAETTVQKEENALEAGVKVYEQAIEGVRNAKTEDELASIVQRTYALIDSVGVSDELESCMAILKSGDTLAFKEREECMKAVLEAADRYMDAVSVAVAELARSNP